MAESAEVADSSLEKLTNPNPLDLPVSLSVITLAVKQTTMYKYVPEQKTGPCWQEI